MGALVLDQPGQRFGDAGILSSLPDEGDRVKGRDKVPPPEGKGELLVQYAAQDPSRLCVRSMQTTGSSPHSRPGVERLSLDIVLDHPNQRRITGCQKKQYWIPPCWPGRRQVATTAAL
jgi:hypothetical protein